MKKIELTPEWILLNLTGAFYANNEQTLIVCYENYHWIKLAFDTIGIKYFENEYINEDSSDDDIEKYENHFVFDLNDIKNECPNLYKNLKELGDRNYDSTI